MITLEIDKLEPGMITAAPIITKRGQTIAKTGTELTHQLIAKLSFYKIETVEVEEPVVEEPVIEDAFLSEPAPAKDYVSDQITYSQRLKASPKFQQFQSDYALNVSYLRENFDAIIAGGGAECEDMLLENCEALFKSKLPLSFLICLETCVLWMIPSMLTALTLHSFHAVWANG